MIFNFLSNLWYKIYQLASFFYTDDMVENKGRKQLVNIYRGSVGLGNNIDNKVNKYYVSGGYFKILTWNIHHGLDWYMCPRLEEIANYLITKHYDTEIICLQEVDTTFIYVPDKGLVNQAIYLAEKIGYYYYYYNNQVILSKAPIIMELEPVYSAKNNSNNMFATRIIGCVIRINEINIRVYNCHLPNDISGVGQFESITNNFNGLLPRVLDDTYNQYPVIIVGDFNSLELFAGIQKLKKITTNATTHHPSYPVIVPLLQLDYILTNGYWVDGMKILNSSADYSCHLSDHYPIVAKVSVPPAN